MAGRGTNGRGTIYKDKLGRWWAQLPKGDDNKRPKVRAESEADAVAKLAELEQKRGRGLNIGDGRQTLEHFLQTWLDEVIAPDRRATTLEDYRQIVRKYITPHLGQVRLCDLNALHIRRWLNKLRAQQVEPPRRKKNEPKKTKKGKASAEAAQTAETVPPPRRTLSVSTRQNIYRRLRTALEFAKTSRLVAENAAALVEPPKGEEREIHPFTPNQARQLLRAVEGDRLAALYLVELSLGLRLGEILGLRWSDLHWERRELKITQTVQTVGNRTVFGEPKTKKSRRTLPLSNEIIVALRAHQRTQHEERKLLGKAWSEHGLIFPSEKGTPIGQRNMLRAFQRLLTRAELPKIRFHDLRHTAASLMLAEGTPITDVSEILGHSSPAITARIYAHAFEERKRSAVETMGRLLQKVSV